MNSHVLEDAICYLIGPIDRVSDQGKGWRQYFTSQCKKNDIRLKVLDPTNKISKLTKEVDEEQKAINRMKSENNWEELSKFMYKVVRSDHRSIDIGDFVVCYIDMSCHMCGSYFELESALSQKKPYFIIVNEGKEKAPAWLFGILDHNKIFNSVDEVIEELKDLNEGKKELDDRWVLIRKEIENL